jgi:hypothetical protein
MAGAVTSAGRDRWIEGQFGNARAAATGRFVLESRYGDVVFAVVP